VAVGDAVYVSAADTVDKADASAAATTPVVGFVVSKPLATTAIVQYDGELGGFAGLTTGARYFLALTAGEIALPGDADFPTLAGEVVQVLGVARNATTLVIDPELDYVIL
jgi:hypothetical protein